MLLVTCNVKGLSTESELCVELKKRKVNIAEVTETKWKLIGLTMIYSDVNVNRRTCYGVTIMPDIFWISRIKVIIL